MRALTLLAFAAMASAFSSRFVETSPAPTPDGNKQRVTLYTGNVKFCGKDLNNFPHEKYATPCERVRIRRERNKQRRRLAAKRAGRI